MADPLYRQIAEDLRRQIESGELAPGDRLPTELELLDTYKASRNTVRDAVKLLITRGLVETRPGQGTFVVEKIVPFVTTLGLDAVYPDSTEYPAFRAEVHAANMRPSISPPRIEVQRSSAQVADQLGLSEGAQVVARHQQRYIDGTPWSVQTTFYPMGLVERGADRLLMAEDIAEGVVAYLERTLGLKQTGWRDTITVRNPSANEAGFFNVPADGEVPVFEVQRTAYDQNGAPLRLTVTSYQADRNRFEVSPTSADLDSHTAAEQAPEAGPPTGASLADEAESEARTALINLAFDDATMLLGRAVELDPNRAARLEPDVNCLSEQPGESPGRLRWRRGLWLALAAGSPLRLPEPEPARDDPPQALPEPGTVTAAMPAARARPRPPRKPQRAGEDLEVAFVRLMERFFSLTADDETRIIKQLRLRRQSAGTQFGHDVQFDCTTVANSVVSCHVECKNYTRELKTSDVAEKILQTQAYWERKDIDYFLILTPLAGISNDLDHFIQTANSRGDLPFRIQAWGPEEGIEEFFAIEPSAYRAVYGSEPPPVPDVAAVVARWANKLKPVLRLPPAVKGYLTNARMHSLVGEDHAHFNALFGESIEVDAMDPTGSPLGRLSDVLADWIDDPARRRFLLLGEFGDGKSFACYQLTRWLAGKYLDDPSANYFPLRLPLRDLVKAGNPQEFLSRRLQALGAGMREWALVQDVSPTLVVLDGFDEMSGHLDQDSVRNNINLLGECVDYFADSKILVTSRTHFFESTRMRARFLERLEHPVVARLAPLPLSKRIDHLHGYAEQHGMSEKFERIRRLYDPIGLAGKPLFLQMIKETLPNLPDDYFDEIVLYETSVRDSLRRKVGLLESERTDSLRSEAMDGMIELLESVAVKLLENDGQPIDLRTFGQERSDIARRLWNISNEDLAAEQAEDATARLGMRSLLKPFPVPGRDDAWPVTFCHRSMSEYFVAQALVRALHRDHEMAGKLLSSVILRPEIVDFAALLVNKSEDTVGVAQTLGRFARSARRRGKSGYLGGNAITLAYRSQHKPADHRWAGLDLCYADLSGADLAGADFTGSLLRYATLDNADLTGADLTRCDLTGVRLEETAPVIHATPGAAGKGVVACYGDGAIREWRLDGSRLVPRMLLDGLANLRSAAWGPHGDLVVVDGSHLSLWTFPEDGPARTGAFPIRTGTEHLRFAGRAVGFTRTDEQQLLAMLVDCQAATVSASLSLTQPGPVVFAGNKTALMSLAGTVTLVHLDQGDPVPIDVPAADVTVLDIRHADPATLQLVVADSKGRVTTLQVAAGKPGPPATQQLHQGPVLSATFLPDGLVATGGMDRSLTICEWDSGQLRVLRRLKLTLRCVGVRTTGVQGDHERKLLEALRDRAEMEVAHV